MSNMEAKKPDQKLKIGAVMTIVTFAISIFWSLIYIIIFLSIDSLLNQFIGKLQNPSPQMITTLKIIIIFVYLIVIIVSSIFIWWATNVLKGKAKDGKALGITILVLSSLALVVSFASWSAIGLISIAINGVGIAAGILLIMGKYIDSNPDNTVVTTNVITSSSPLSSEQINNDNNKHANEDKSEQEK